MLISVEQGPCKNNISAVVYGTPCAAARPFLIVCLLENGDLWLAI